MNRLILAAAACFALAGCSQTQLATSAYALTAGLDTAEKAAATYEASPLANASVVALIKADDAKAFAVIGPMAANGNNVTADELAAGQAALSLLTADMTANGVK